MIVSSMMSTFYAHYRDKDDLLRAGFEDIRAALAAERDAAEQGAGRKAELLQPMLAVFQHVGAHRHFWESMSRKGGANLVTRILRESVSDLVREHFRSQFPDARKDQPQLDAAIQFVTGACMGLRRLDPPYHWILFGCSKRREFIGANTRRTAFEQRERSTFLPPNLGVPAVRIPGADMRRHAISGGLLRLLRLLLLSCRFALASDANIPHLMQPDHARRIAAGSHVASRSAAGLRSSAAPARPTEPTASTPKVRHPLSKRADTRPRTQAQTRTSTTARRITFIDSVASGSVRWCGPGRSGSAAGGRTAPPRWPGTPRRPRPRRRRSGSWPLAWPAPRSRWRSPR